jgi:CHAT domain-containing protein/tetratricopeptide (TPR) repeat protein
MKRAIFFLMFVISLGLRAQEFYVQLQKEVYENVQQKKYSAALERSSKFVSVHPDQTDVLTQHIFCLINLNKTAEAEVSLKRALTMDPTNSTFHVLQGYFDVAAGNNAKAKEEFILSIKYSSDEANLQEWVDEFKTVGANLNKSQEFNSVADWVRQNYSSIRERWPSIEKMINEFQSIVPLAPDKVVKKAEGYALSFNAMGMPEMGVAAYLYASRFLATNGFPSESIEAATAGYQHEKKFGHGGNTYIACELFVQLMDGYMATEDNEKALQFVDEGIQLINQLQVHGPDVRLLIKTSQCYVNLRGQPYDTLKKRQQEYAAAAYSLASKFSTVDELISSANTVCMAYLGTDSPEKTSISVKYGEYAVRLAQQYNLATEAYIGNLAIAYWRQGVEGQTKCLNLYRDIIDKEKAKGNFTQASLNLNNLGAIYFNAGRYDDAARFFEESVQLAGDGSKFSQAGDRLNYYAAQLTASDFLIACYAHQRNAAKAFEALEGRRARVLAERIGAKSDRKPELADLQTMLKPDEACIMYSVFSAHEIIILTVTKKYAQVIFHNDPRFIGDIKDKFYKRGSAQENSANNSSRAGFDWVSLKGQRAVISDNYNRDAVASRPDFERTVQLTRKYFEQPGLNDELLMDFLNRYQKFLIVPILNRLSGVKNLLISPDDILNFIPFEALRTFDGKYLCENYSIRYFHSYSVLQQLQQRQYSNDRKPLLAMGGAIYEDLTDKPLPAGSQEKFNQLQAEVFQKVKTGESMRRVYATVFGTQAFNPLPGTLDEVKNISGNLPGAEIFVGKDMTETRIKLMSKEGKLKNYKMLHLATHGFVVSELPDLSGIAMSVFSNEQDGEDGFLNVNEITNLKLNTELTVLSACQTAQGKYYTGEGVTGLTQSLMIAGSNAALVSLWPVNDTSTMLFMSNFYKEVAKGKPYVQIVTDLKRKFIKGAFGKEFQHPNYWAPFIYYGK